MSMHKIFTGILVSLAIFLTGCQTPAEQTPGAPDPTTVTGEGLVVPPSDTTLPQDDEKTEPDTAPRNIPEETEPGIDEQSLNGPSEADQAAMSEAIEKQDQSICNKIQMQEYKEACVSTLEDVGGAPETDENDRASEFDAQEYGETEEPPVEEESA